MPPSTLNAETCYRLLQLLERNPAISQRELAKNLHISLGKANYCLHALIDRGLVKVVNFRRSNNKIAYLYKLTPEGIGEKVRAAQRFLQRKVQEHQALEAEIEVLRTELCDLSGRTSRTEFGSTEQS